MLVASVNAKKYAVGHSNRLWNYRYGFNGKESDDEVKGNGNSYDYGARMYDPRVGRWFTVDALAFKFPSNSPYVFVNNVPTISVDPDGKSGIVTIDKENKQVTVHMHLVFYGDPGEGVNGNEFAYSEALKMQENWRSANGTVTIDDIEYKVHFVITGEYCPSLTKEEVEANQDYAMNYIHIDNQGELGGEMDGDPGPPGNTGYFNPSKMRENTSSHEGGHLMGLKHPNADVKDKKPTSDQNPGIMATIGTPVKKQFAYDTSKDSWWGWNEKVQAVGWNNTLDPSKRKVTQKNIDDLGLDKIKFDNNGNGKLGTLTNEYHE